MWFKQAIAVGGGQSVSCYTDLSESYVYPTLFSEYPVFTIWDLMLSSREDPKGYVLALLNDKKEETKKAVSTD